ncbi:MAG: hypothetical protein ACTFAK_16465 [Candidatus Electronema sp. VV]
MDAIPKTIDIQSLHSVSKVIVLPMLIAASIIQCNFSAFGIAINQEDAFKFQVINFLIVFIVHSFVVGSIAVSIHWLLFLVQIFSNFIALSILSMLFLSFGFLGVYSEHAPLIGKSNPMWFYASFVCGFYFLSRESDIDKQIEVQFN